MAVMRGSLDAIGSYASSKPWSKILIADIFAPFAPDTAAQTAAWGLTLRR